MSAPIVLTWYAPEDIMLGTVSIDWVALQEPAVRALWRGLGHRSDLPADGRDLAEIIATELRQIVGRPVEVQQWARPVTESNPLTWSDLVARAGLSA